VLLAENKEVSLKKIGVIKTLGYMMLKHNQCLTFSGLGRKAVYAGVGRSFVLIKELAEIWKPLGEMGCDLI